MRADRSLTVLCVDDDGGDRQLLCDAFSENGIRVNFVGLDSSEGLLAYLRDASGLEGNSFPDIILLDLNMQPSDGREALKKIKSDKRFRHVPVVVISASPDPADIALTYRLGGNSFLRKPEDFDGLVELVRVFVIYWFDVCELPSRTIH